ncbi:MAG: ABC transporter ATP-binding protein [Dehalococcoidales bacterium]|nr:ABC transporter ATP-binding protein [Dehalococcoidales bacterium]
MAQPAVLEIEDLWVKYDGTVVLEAVDLSLYHRDFLGIIGPNGGGKTTLLRTVLGLINPDRGKVRVMGKPASDVNVRGHIGYVPQYSLFDRDFPVNVRDVVLMGRLGAKRLFHNYRAADINAARQALKSVDMLEYQDRQIGRLSGGQQQRVFVARALVGEPKLLLLDEPMASVDTAMQEGFYQLLARLKKEMTIVIVSHDISAVSIYVDKIACLNRRLFYHGTKEISADDLEATYQCPIQMIAHGIPHRVLKKHGDR